MAFSLYAATIPSYRQILGPFPACSARRRLSAPEGVHLTDIIQARLAEDMLPFAYQVKSTAVHSLGAIEGVRRCLRYDPAPREVPRRSRRESLKRSPRSRPSRPRRSTRSSAARWRFAFGDRQIDYTAENFLISFSQPNFYFHATTAYDILRWKGVPIGKRDFMGKTRTKR